MKLVTNKSKNLLYRIVDGGNVNVQFGTSYAIATQITADTAVNLSFKLIGYKNNGVYTSIFGGVKVPAIGKITKTFITPSTTEFDYIRFGLNGSKIDTACTCYIDLKPSTTYTFTCNFTNITQGSISWKDMMLVEGSEAGDYEPYSYNLLDKWKFVSSFTDNGNVYTNDGEGNWYIDSLNGIGNSYGAIGDSVQITPGHKVLLRGTYPFENTQDLNGGYFYCIGQNSYELNIGEDIETIPEGISYLTPRMSVYVKTRVDNKHYVPQLYDLTLMYGEGNEPTTIAQFYQDHPELKVSPLGFIGLKNLEISNKNIKRLRYATTTRNLFDSNIGLSLENDCKVSYSGNTIIFTALGGTATPKFMFNKITVEVGKTYTISADWQKSENSISLGLFISDETTPDKATYGVINETTRSKTFTATSTDLYIKGYVDYRKQLSSVTIANLQLEEGSTATSYVPYGYLDLGIIPSNSGYILNEYNNLTEELLEENVELPSGNWNNSFNILDKSSVSSTKTISGVTVTDNGNGSLNVFGTCTAGGGRNIWGITAELVKNHIYFTNSIYGDMSLYLTSYTVGSTYFGVVTNIFTFTLDSGKYNFGYNLNEKAVYDLDIYPQLIDLTKLYGAGKEPTTVDQFYKDYPGLKNNINNYHIPDKTNILLNKVEGKTNKIVQMYNLTPMKTATSRGITYTKNSNGTFTSNGTATGEGTYDLLSNMVPTVGHKYLCTGAPAGGGITSYRITNSILNSSGSYVNGFSDSGSGNISRELRDGEKINSYMVVVSGYTVSNLIFAPQFFDLTAMYGYGKEPTTVEQFKKDYPQFFDEKLDGVWNVRTSGISTKDLSDNYDKIDLLSTQTLNGINGVNDYIEVIDKGNGLYDLKKTQNIDSVDLGTLTWDIDGSNFYSSSINSVIKPATDNAAPANCVCDKYTNYSINKSFVNGDFAVNTTGYIYFRNSAYTTAAAFKTAVTGTILYYQLATPVTTTIATNLTYSQVSALRTNGGLLLVNENINQKYVQPNVMIKENYAYIN